MLRQLLEEQRSHLNHFFDRIDLKEVEAVVDACAQCTGLIVLTGVGKSGIIAEKIAMTLVSTGTKALYLPPTNFLHGDIGILSENDLLILISKSGETEELLDLLPFVRRRKTPTVALVSHTQSRLAKECLLSVTLPVEKELCPFDLAPTTSTEVQLLFGDMLAVALMKKKEFQLSEYAQNHPSGTIGKKMTLRLEDLMLKEDLLPLCNPEDRLLDLLPLLSNKKCGCLLIATPQRSLQGIFTDGDLRRALQSHGPAILDRPISSLMTPTAIAFPKDLLAWDALRLMQKDPKRWVMVAPVLEEERIVGIVRMHDIIQAGLA